MEQILTRCWPGFARWRTYIMMRSHQMIAGFSLNEANWKRFSRFFAPHPTDVLQPHHLSTTSFGRHEGHAVVITGESQDAWFIKTSWREGFAEEGFFRVAKTSIEFSFYDVCFRMCDLTRSERNAYRLAPPLLEVTGKTHTERYTPDMRSVSSMALKRRAASFQSCKQLRLCRWLLL